MTRKIADWYQYGGWEILYFIGIISLIITKYLLMAGCVIGGIVMIAFGVNKKINELIGGGISLMIVGTLLTFIILSFVIGCAEGELELRQSWNRSTTRVVQKVIRVSNAQTASNAQQNIPNKRISVLEPKSTPAIKSIPTGNYVFSNDYFYSSDKGSIKISKGSPVLEIVSYESGRFSVKVDVDGKKIEAVDIPSFYLRKI